MNAIIENEMKQVANANIYTRLKKLGAVGGLLFGLTLLVSGVVLSVLAFFEQINFDNTELIMIAVSFVLLGIGAHCLDLLEKERKQKNNKINN